MCGRYNLYNFKDIKDRYNLNRLDFELHENYNVSPSQINPVITRNSPNKIEMMKWGFIPFWAKDPRIGFKMINARAETLTHKIAFKHALKQARCLVPTNGFYEWKKLDKNTKIPYHFKMQDDSLFSFAGLFSTWKDAEGKEIKSYTIITTSPSKLMEPIHNRMPVIIDRKDENLWLEKNTSLNELLSLLKPYENSNLARQEITKDINNPRNNKPELLNSL